VYVAIVNPLARARRHALAVTIGSVYWPMYGSDCKLDWLQIVSAADCSLSRQVLLCFARTFPVKLRLP